MPVGRLPSAWGQAYPRGLTLGRDGMLVPAATLRVLLRSGRRSPLGVVGYSMVPCIGHGDEILVEGGGKPRAGDVVVSVAGNWPELRRVVAVTPAGACRTALDVLPGMIEEVPGDSVLGIVQGVRGAGDGLGRLVAAAHPVWSRFAAASYWWSKVAHAPGAEEATVETIERKYQWQVQSYESILQVPLGDPTLDLVGRWVHPGGVLLVPGSGVGREALHLARAGYKVIGVDLIPEMVQAAVRHATEEKLDAEFVCGDIATLDFGARRFDGVYMTPLVYSFIPGRERRIACLRQLGRHLVPGGAVLYSAHLVRRAGHLARLVAIAARRRLRQERRREFGDWFTWFLTPEGRLGTAFSHRFLRWQVRDEARAAGFRKWEDVGNSHFAASDHAA